MARLVKTEVSQTLFCDINTIHTDDSVETRRVKVGDIVEGLRYVENSEVKTITGKVVALVTSGKKVTNVKVNNVVDYFAEDIKVTGITIDASAEYQSNVVTVNTREIVEDEGVEDVKRMRINSYASVQLILTYTNGEVDTFDLEIMDVLKNVRIMTTPGQADIEDNFVIRAWGYTISNNVPTIDSIYLVPTAGGTAIKADLKKIIGFEEVPHDYVTDTTSLSSIAQALAASETGEVFAQLDVDVTIPKREDGSITTLMVGEGQKLEIDLNGHTLNTEAYAFYVNGGELLISDYSGKGTIECTRQDAAYPAVFVATGGVCTMTSGTIDTTHVDTSDGHVNWLYGIACSGDGIFNMTGGEIITGAAAGIAITNGTATGVGARFTIGGNAVLRAEENVAVYLADNKSVVIKDHAKIYGGILARMGDIIIEDNAYVEGIAEGKEASNLGTLGIVSGCDTCAAPVTAMLGVYGSSLGNDFNLTVAETATLKAFSGYPVAMALVNTKYDQNALCDIASAESLKPAVNADLFHVYSHDELAELALEDGRTMAAETNTTNLTIKINGEIVYPVVDGD